MPTPPTPTTRLLPKMPVSLEQSYALCKDFNKRHGTTYYWSTKVLPAEKRPHVHALYGFCRYADDIVDDLGPVSVEERRAALASFGQRFFRDLDAGSSTDPVLMAVVDTVRKFPIDPECFRRFLRSMTMDLTVDRYQTWGDLLEYMDGSAAVIGEMMLPILEPHDSSAFGHARDLGNAFQLTNFLRDVNEDLDRGRVYIPQEDVRRFGVDLSTRRCTTEFTQLMKFEIHRCRELYESADRGIAMLPNKSARCIRAARSLYSEILDRIERQNYDVFAKRASVPTSRKALMVARLVFPLGS